MAIQSRFNSRTLIENRQVRIFLSSTFSDMQEERTALLKTFDALRVKAHRRNVGLTVLDLRWGVTDDEARSGKVISVCLNEIEHSHPFFIGLLGSRYGYAPDAEELEKDPDLLERYPWIADDIRAGRSITEMEMLYGVLRNEGDVDASFYIKNTTEPDDNPRQTALKTTIRRQQRFPVTDYASVDELCALVECEVTALLDRHFPDVETTSLERIRTAHRAFANSRLGHFVGREEELGWLDAFVRSGERHLVITGDSGMGKSALLSRWCRQNEESDDFNLVYHFVGNTLGSSNYEGILRHLCDEIYDLYNLERSPNQQEKIDDEAQRLISELAHCKKSLVIVIDGINQLSAPKDEKLLLWLPNANAHVKFIFTTLADDETMRTFERRGYSVRTLQPLTDTQRRSFAEGYLERVGKHLSPAQWQRILDDPENRNTLVLCTLLDELICFGSHEQLDTRIDFYLAAKNTEDFFNRVLQRMEQDYGHDLVSRSLALLALSEHGMSEEELLAITGLRQLDWHLFYCAAYNHLMVRNDLIGFAHQYIAVAVKQRYFISDATTSEPLRHDIVRHFAALPHSDRRTSELAHQYYHLADWQHLHDTLAAFDAFYYFYSANAPLLALYWRTLIRTGYSLSTYLQLSHGAEDADLAAKYNYIGHFVADYFADFNLALEYYDKALTIRGKVIGMEHPYTAISHNNIGLVYNNMGDHDKALEYFGKALVITENVLGTEHPYTATFYNNIGLVYGNMSDYDKALEYFGKALAITEKVLGLEHPDTAMSYSNIGSAYYYMGDYDKAPEYHCKALAIREKVLGTEHPDTASSYSGIGSIYNAMGDHNKALEYHGKALAIKEKVLGLEHPDTAMSYNNIGVVYSEMGDYDKALEYHSKALAIREKVLGTEHSNTASSYNNIGSMYSQMGDYDKALDYHGKGLAIREKVLGLEHPDTASSYNSIGLAHDNLGDYDKALEYHGKALAIREKVLGLEHPDTASSYSNIGVVHTEMGDYDKALEYHSKALAIREKVLGTEHPDTATSYINIGAVYYYMGDYGKALECYRKALEIRNRTLGENHTETTKIQKTIDFIKSQMDG